MATVSDKLLGQAKGKTQGFLSRLKKEFLESPLASNVVLGFILTGFEKLVELDFACPCIPSYNACFAAAYFVIPGLFASVLMLCIQGCKQGCCTKQMFKCLLFGMVPAIMWLIVMFFDGQYYACANTNWSGRFVNVDKTDHQKWCEPNNSTLSHEKMSQTQQWYFHSQLIGLVILALSTIPFGLYKCLTRNDSQGQGNGSNDNALGVPLTVAPV